MSIEKKELNIKYGELELLFENIRNIIDYFEKSRFNERTYKLYLSNGDNINYKVFRETVPHLLGVDTNYLHSTGLFKAKNSFEILKELVDNPYRILKYVNEGRLNYNNIFSQYIFEKVDIFKENIKVNVYNTELICKYRSDRTYLNNDKHDNCDYVIVKKYEDGKIGIITLVKNLGNFYVPMSNRIYNDFKEAKDDLRYFLQNQEVSIINNIIAIDNMDYKKTFSLPLSDKAAKVSNIRNIYKEQFDVIIDVSNDFVYSLNKAQEHFNEKDVIELIVECITNGKIINKYPQDSRLIPIINAINDFLCNNPADNKGAKEAYSSVLERLNKSKEIIEALTNENNELKTENTNLNKKNNELADENNKLNETHNKILELLKPSE